MLLPKSVLDRVRGARARDAAALLAFGVLGGCGAGAQNTPATTRSATNTEAPIVAVVAVPAEQPPSSVVAVPAPEEDYAVDCGRG